MGEQKEQAAGTKEREPIKGIFSTQELKKVGAGTTVRKTVQKAFWSVEEAGGKIEVQPLNANYVPSGPKRTISLEELIEKFQPEPEFYVQTVFPKMKELNKTIARADRHRQRGEGFSAEFEYNNALKVDEQNVRANFGLGLTYLDRGETEKADNIFERLVKLDAAFDVEHKHLFNEFGINLRKNKMLDQARDYYSRALELSGNDENLHYNVARVCLEKQEYAPCAEHLLKCLAINPSLDAAVKFLLWLKQKDFVPAEKKAEVDAQLVKSAQAIKRQKEGGEAPAAKPEGTAAPATPQEAEGEAE
ncbi:hypothetical protein N1030_17405 [Desulfovibrio mangrovi]|uniref:hypothetical protein n=1 Tax=Desulfovibrio mangrovi TaxID=2976983 RepID=UPI002247D03D|nr:hypothetical protein [Desulfovibrio mangrovi]UZP67350.1 hypothetical protein N1030_17405 [Desulfovibrio mangrovi]